MAGRDVNININGKDNFSQAANSAGRSANSLKATLSSINGPLGGGGGLTSLLGGVGLAGATTAAVSFGVKTAAAFEQTNVAFKTMLKSGGAAKDLLTDISKFAQATPFQFSELTDASKKLLAFGVNANDIVPTLKRIGDVSSGIGAPIGEIAELYGKAKVQGRLFAQDINQLTGRGIPIIQELAKQFNTMDDNVKNLVERGQVGFQHLEQAFKSMTSAGGQFAGLMEAQSQTLIGKWSSLKDAIELLARTWGEKLIPVIKMHVDLMNFAMGQGLPDIKVAKGAKFDDVYQGGDRKNAAEFLNLGNAIDAGKAALKNEKDPAKRAILEKQIADAEARRKAVGEEFRANVGVNKAGREKYGTAIGGGLVGGAADAASGLGGLLGGAFGAVRDGTASGVGMIGNAVEKEKLRRKLFEETRTPQEKFDSAMADLRSKRGEIGDDLFNRKRRMLEDDLAGTFDKNDPKKKDMERRGLAPLTEARFLTSAPGYAADPATKAAQENANIAKEQLVVLRAMERKLARQTRLGVL